MRKFRFISFLFLMVLGLNLSSCMDFEMIKFLGVDGFEMPKMDNREIWLNLKLKIDNPNKFGIKIKPSDIAVFVKDQKMGVVHLDKKIKFKKKREGIYETKLKINLEDGAFFSMMKLAQEAEFPVRFVGKLKGSVYGITKKIDFDQTKTMSGSDLKMDQFFKKKS